MKKIIQLCLILTLLVFTMTSCPLLDSLTENGSTDPVEIVHNPKNLLFVEQSDNTFDRRTVFLEFTTPEEFGATSYTLQFSSSNDPFSFETMMNGEDEYTTTNPLSSGYDVELPDSHSSGYFRLLINGGEYDGEYSNIEYSTQCEVDVDVNWSLDYSMVNTGIMMPYVGFGIVAEFSLVDYDTRDNIDDGMTYQWYRMNPNDYEDRELIVGETGLTYTTQTADINHVILVIATGVDGKFTGGMCCAKIDFVVEP